MKIPKALLATHAGLVAHLAKFGDYEDRIDKAMPAIRKEAAAKGVAPALVERYRLHLLREVDRMRG